MSISQLTGAAKPVHLWTDLDSVEDAAQNQLRNIANLPWIHSHVAVMPDVHFGKGATVGSVVAMKGAVSPAAVGVDIGCGMTASRLNITSARLPENLDAIRASFESSVPVGFNQHGSGKADGLELWSRYGSLHERAQKIEDRARKQVGTLGGGNHFIELCIDTTDQVWLLLHSGSRNIGKSLAEWHIDAAKSLEHNIGLPDKDLAVFLDGTPQMQAYWNDLTWAQEYAYANREVMAARLFKSLRHHLGEDLAVEEFVTCHHNYVSREHHFGEDVIVTRKGAIAASAGMRGLIPGSMGTRSYVVTGLGNPLAFNSASHGAGRRMSRGQAKREFTLADLEAQTAGVNCRKDAGVLDEIPGAYKSIDEVMANQADLVRIDHELRQVLCVKG